MSSILSCYYSAWHWRTSDMDYMRRLTPTWVRIHQPSARAIANVQAVSPDTKIMLRSWDIDDNNGDRKRELYANPLAAARAHMDLWGAKRTELRMELERSRLPYDESKWYFGLVNEPDPAYLPQVVTYTLEAMRIAKERGRHLGVIASSVGTFGKPGEGGNTWDLAKPLEGPINDGGHILIAHEYWQPEGPSAVWIDNEGKERSDAGNLAWRHKSIPLNVPILIGEAGANGYIYNRHSAQDDAGWRKFMQPEQYAAQVKEYIEGCDSRVQGVCLYMLDFHSDQWWSFDTEPAMEELLAIKDTRPAQQQPTPPPPTVISLPIVVGPEKPPAPTPPAPQSPPSGIVDPLVLEAILAIESGGAGFGPDGRVKIRFEAHIFEAQIDNAEVFAQSFRYGKPAWTGQKMGIGAAWLPIHTGAQATEWQAYNSATYIDPEAAAKSISMGAAQIMGFNHARIGYPSAQAMLQAFRNPNVQVIGFLNFLLSDAALWQAVRKHDWREIAARYNGAGNVDVYSKLLADKYDELKAAA